MFKNNWLKRVMIGGGTVVTIAAGAAAFSAFEAHVINVTATIENALNVPLELRGMDFGTVFPEEVLHQNLDINLSGSFLDEDRVDDVEYIIRQKPKCGIPIPDTNPVEYSGFVQVTHGVEGTFVCPEVTVVPPTGGEAVKVQSVELPLLCPFLSKHEITTDGTEEENDGAGIDSFHGPLTGWDQQDSVLTQVLGRLVKAGGDTSDTWDIDLHVPAFQGQVAQDGVIPEDYLLDPALEHQVFGCDLWVEVTEISLPGEKANLTVIKHVDNSSGTDDKIASDFTIDVSGPGASPSSFPGSEAGTLVTMSPGAYSVTEPPVLGYTTAYSVDCVGVLAANDSKVCTVTNTANAVETGTLTVTKVVTGGSATASDFSFTVNGGGSTAFEADGTNVTVVTVGSYDVVEDPEAGYTTTYANSFNANADCNDLAVPLGGNVTCTITNTAIPVQTLTVIKVVENNGVGVGGVMHGAGDFQLQIDAVDAAQSTPIEVSAGSHTVSEVDDLGYNVSFSGDCNGAGVVDVPENGSATCTVTNSAPFFTMTVTKVVTNNNGGNNAVEDFNLFFGVTAMSSGDSQNFAPGTYLVSESGVSGYAASFAGDCDPDTQLVEGADGDVLDCTITNDDIAPNITLIKVVTNDSDGTAVATDFIMRIDGGVPVPTSSSKVVTANAAHTIDEDGKTGYHFVSLTGSPECPLVLGGTATLVEGQAITCTITNSDDGGDL